MPVSEKLAYEIFNIELWHILSLIFSLSVNYLLYLKARKTPLLYSYLFAQLMLAIWIVSKIIKTVSPTIELRWIFVVLQYVGASFLGVALLLFAYIYSRKAIPSKPVLLLLSLPAACSFAVVLTNPLHHLFYKTFTFYKDTFGPLFYINMIITYSYLTVSIFLLGRNFFKMHGGERIRAVLFAAGIIIPLIVNIFYIFKLFKLIFGFTPLFDFTPIATNVSLVIFAIAAFKFRFLDLVPFTETAIMDMIPNPIFLQNDKNQVIHVNKASARLLPAIETGKMTGTAEVPAEHFNLHGQSYTTEMKSRRGIRVYQCRNTTGLDHIFAETREKSAELSKMTQMLEGLYHDRQALARLKIRDYLLQELHDVLGHACVLAISACEVELLSGQERNPSIFKSIKSLLEESRDELENAFSNYDGTGARTSLIVALETLKKRTEGTSVEVGIDVVGDGFEISEESAKAFYRLCLEALTNTFRHSGASRLDIVIRYNKDNIEIFVIDNGSGCAKIKKGKGLGGIEKRILECSGVVRFSSDEHCGFQIYAMIPRENCYES